MVNRVLGLQNKKTYIYNMKNGKLLLTINIIFGVIALLLYTLRCFKEIDIIYPICCNVIQFITIIIQLIKN